MNRRKIDIAQEAARRFLEAAKAADDAIVRQTRELRGNGPSVIVGPDASPTTGTRETGALRRASMDLTRALADLRRPG